MQKFLENLQEAERKIQTADHLVYVTYPLIKDKRILLKILTETKNAVASCINSILQYEYLYKRINLYQDPKVNFETFINKSSKRFTISSIEIKSILELFEITELHKQSPMEFIKDNKVIILTNNSKIHQISIEKIKEFLSLSKNILQKAKNKILGKI